MKAPCLKGQVADAVVHSGHPSEALWEQARIAEGHDWGRREHVSHAYNGIESPCLDLTTQFSVLIYGIAIANNR